MTAHCFLETLLSLMPDLGTAVAPLCSAASELSRPCTHRILQEENVSALETCSELLKLARNCLNHNAVLQEKMLHRSVACSPEWINEYWGTAVFPPFKLILTWKIFISLTNKIIELMHSRMAFPCFYSNSTCRQGFMEWPYRKLDRQRGWEQCKSFTVRKWSLWGRRKRKDEKKGGGREGGRE